MIVSSYKTSVQFIKTIILICGLLPEYPYGTKLEYPLWNYIKWGHIYIQSSFVYNFYLV